MTLALLVTLAAAPELTYFGDILPRLREGCLGCHTHGVNMGSLDLETWDGVVRGGNQGTILTPGQPGESRLYTMLAGQAEPRMPLDGREFPAASIDLIRRWIAAGAASGLAPERFALAWRPDGEAIAASGWDGRPGWWNARTGALTGARTAPGGPWLALVYEGETLWAVESAAGTLRVRDAALGPPVREWSVGAGHGAVALGPGARSVAVVRDGMLRVGSDGRWREMRPGEGRKVTALAWSADGGRLAVALAGARALLLRARDLTVERELALPRDACALAFSPDGQRLAAGCGREKLDFVELK